MTKPDLRRALRARLQNLGDARAANSRAIVAALAAHPAFLAAQTVALFAPLPTEPDVELLWEKSPRQFCYPRVTGPQIEFVIVRHPEDLAPAAWNPLVREPAAAQPTIPVADLDLILVPGLAFTRDGRRLGRGGGYYDRLLAARAPHTATLGICFDLQFVPDLPCEPHDQRVDAVVTEGGLVAR